MDTQERLRRANNAAKAIREAQTLHDKAVAALSDPNLASNAREALEGVQWFTAGALMSLHLRDFDDGKDVLYRAERLWGEAERLRLEPDAAAGARHREGGRKGSIIAHGTPEEIDLERARLAEQFRYCMSNGAKSKGAAKAAVAKANGCSTRTVERALKWAREKA